MKLHRITTSYSSRPISKIFMRSFVLFSMIAAPVYADNAYPASVKNPAHFHPGYYLSVGQAKIGSDPKALYGALAGNADIVGAKRVFRWKDLETGYGIYDFSSIGADLAYLKSIGKQYWINIATTQFDGTSPPNTPQYMLGDATYGCGPKYYGNFARKAQAGGWLPCYWNANFASRFAALMTALGQKLNNDSNFEGLDLGETAISDADARGVPGYTVAAVEDGYKKNALAAKSAFPDKVIIQNINFAVFNLKRFSTWLAQNGIGIGNPDMNFSKPPLTKTVYPLELVYHNEVPTAPQVQWSNYTNNTITPGDDNIAETLLKRTIKDTNPYYLMWQKRKPFWPDQVLAAIRKVGPLPAAAQFYSSVVSTSLPKSGATATTSLGTRPGYGDAH